MTQATPEITLTVYGATKAMVIAGKVSLYETRTINIVTDTGATWPSGDYTLAVTYKGRSMASATCTNAAGALSCTLSLNTTELEALFDAIGRESELLDWTLWDDVAHTAWGRAKIRVYATEWTEATASPTVTYADYYSGQTSVTNGADSVTVDISSLALTAAPYVVASVQGPAGASNIFGTVSNITATSFVVLLSANVPSAGYSVAWVVYT